MKTTLLRLLPLLGLFALTLRAADDNVIAAVRAADDARVAALKRGDVKTLGAINSDALHYAHSSGKIDNKASYLKARAAGYGTFDYQRRDFAVVAPGVVVMTGRVLTQTVRNDPNSELDLNFLAVWRLEGGQWRFFAWQSCKNSPAGAK
jgi:hypothetical protein